MHTPAAESSAAVAESPEPQTPSLASPTSPSVDHDTSAIVETQTAAAPEQNDPSPQLSSLPSAAADSIPIAGAAASVPQPGQAQTFTFAGQTVAAVAGGLQIQSQTLTPGASITLKPQAQVSAGIIQTDAISDTEVVIGSLPPAASSPSNGAVVEPVIIDGQAVTPTSGVYVVQGQTLSPGVTLVISPEAAPSVGQVQTNAIGQTEVVVGSSTVTLPTLDVNGEAAPITIAGQAVTATGGVYMAQGQTLTPGIPITLSPPASPTIAQIQTNAVGQSEIIVGTSTATLPSNGGSVPITIAGQAFTPTIGVYVAQGQTLTPGMSLSLSPEVLPTIASVQTNANGQTEIIVGSSTATLPSLGYGAAGAIVTIAGQLITPTGGVYVAQGQTLMPGELLSLSPVAQPTIAKVQTDAYGRTELVVGSSTTTLAAVQHFTFDASIPTPAVFTFAGQTFSASSGNIIVQGQTITPGATVTFSSGSHATTARIQTDTAGRTELIVGSSTTTLAPNLAGYPETTAGATITFRGQVLTEVAGHLVVQGRTIMPGSSLTLGSGSQTTVVAMATDAAGHVELIVGSSTTVLPAIAQPTNSAKPTQFLLGGQVITESAGEFIVQGHTITPGGSATLGSGRSKTVVAVTTDSAGHTELIVGDATLTLTGPGRPFTAAAHIFTPVAGNAFVVDGKTLTMGSTITLGSGSLTTKVVLTTDSRGWTEIVEPSTTILLGSARPGGFILSGLMPHVSTTATPSPTRKSYPSAVSLASNAAVASPSPTSAGSVVLMEWGSCLALGLSLLHVYCW